MPSSNRSKRASVRRGLETPVQGVSGGFRLSPIYYVVFLLVIISPIILLFLDLIPYYPNRIINLIQSCITPIFVYLLCYKVLIYSSLSRLRLFTLYSMILLIFLVAVYTYLIHRNTLFISALNQRIIVTNEYTPEAAHLIDQGMTLEQILSLQPDVNNSDFVFTHSSLTIARTIQLILWYGVYILAGCVLTGFILYFAKRRWFVVNSYFM